MQTILGPFHPHLEDAFIEEILRFKSADPLCPLLTAVPSDSLRRRLKTLCARERQLSFVNLQILTFYQLSLRLFIEANCASVPVLHDDLFLEEALRQMIRARAPGTAAFIGIEERAGGCAALWQTLRDLRDGLVDAAVALEALREGHFAQRTSQRTSDLLALLQTLMRFCAEKNIQDDSDLDKTAAAQAPQSLFLKQFSHIFYYGFYDLTQLQIDFFDAVAQHYPTTLFFPLLAIRLPHDGWSFAERFYRRYVQGRSGGEHTRNLADEWARTKPLPLTFGVFDQAAQRTFQSMPANWHCTIFNTFGIHDEVSAVAKEILRLTAEEGTAFEEIGVVARSLETYGAIIKEIFSQHQIPLATTIEEPLTRFPLTQASLLLLNLPAKDYLRCDVIDLLSSPYFRGAPGGEPLDLRPDLWDLATRELAICKSMKEWQRLERHTAKGLDLTQVSPDREPRVIKIPPEQIRALLNTLNRLVNDLSRLPSLGSWSQYAASWKSLLKQYLGVADEPASDDHATDTMIGAQISTLLDRIAGLDIVHPEVSLREFSQTFQHWLERTPLVRSRQRIRGVEVLNATEARGLAFRALFVVGMNEGVFPRTIREDAFLRDRDREVLERDLGYKVSQKLAAFDEEKLLFALLVTAARERFYCSFQRSDESGRVLAPSWYLADLKRALGGAGAKPITEKTLPRSIMDKVSHEPFSREDLLLPEELAIQLSLAGKEAVTLIEAAELSPGLYKAGIKTIERLDVSSQRLGEFDGMLAQIEDHRRHFSQRSLSPTGLELYNRCPFQYFALQVLGLERLEAPEESAGPSAADYGNLGHAILKTTYQELMDRSYFTKSAPAIDVDAVLATAAQRAFAEYEAEHPLGYPLAWENLCENLTEILRAVLHCDLKELRESGYQPVALESGIEDKLSADWPQPLQGFPVHGRMDRIDIDQAGNRVRIVDYKFKLGAGPSTADRDLRRAALRGEKLQPPIYSVLGKRWMEVHRAQAGALSGEACFFYLAPRWRDGPLVIQSFGFEDLSGRLGAEVKETVSQLVAGIQSGRFFIQRGQHCQYCEVTEICRKNHPPSLWRAENDPITEAHRRLHDKDLKEL